MGHDWGLYKTCREQVFQAAEVNMQIGKLCKSMRVPEKKVVSGVSTRMGVSGVVCVWHVKSLKAFSPLNYCTYSQKFKSSCFVSFLVTHTNTTHFLYNLEINCVVTIERHLIHWQSRDIIPKSLMKVWAFWGNSNKNQDMQLSGIIMFQLVFFNSSWWNIEQSDSYYNIWCMYSGSKQPM